MTTDYQLRALETVRSRFQAGASRYHDLSFRLIEATGDSRLGILDPPGRPERKSSIATYSVQRYSFLLPGVPPSGSSRQAVLGLLPEEAWFGEFFFGLKDAADEFATLAHGAWTLLLELPIQIPIPPHVVPRLAACGVGATSILPEWTNKNDPFSFAHAVNWIARAKVFSL